MSVETYTATELTSMTLEPGWADADPDRRPLLVVDLWDADGLSPAAAVRVCEWLATQPVPCIGVVDRLESTATPGAGTKLGPLELLAESMDVLVDRGGELDRLVASIRMHPVASAVLVQVLRATGDLNLIDALTVESLAYATLQSGREFAAWLSGRPRMPVPAGGDDVVLLNRTGDRLEIVLNDPDNRNALCVPMRDALTDAFKLVRVDTEIRHVEISGNGPCFSAGGDLGEFGTAVDTANAHRVRMLRMPARYLAGCGERYTFRVHGACIGAGIELPAFAGRISAAKDTFFQLPEVAMGLIPGAGGCVSIPRRIGRQRTAYMAILGDRISAERALAWGLVDAIEN